MRRGTKEMLNDMDYVTKLGKTDRKWLYKAVSGITNANPNTLAEILPTLESIKVYEDCENARNSYRRDLMNTGSRVITETFSTGDAENYLPCIREETTVSSFEDALIEAIDNEKSGIPNAYRAYGNNAVIPVGSDVVICVEGHAMQNRLGKVVAQRRGQYLVQVQSPKGDISIYLEAYELARVNTSNKAI